MGWAFTNLDIHDSNHFKKKLEEQASPRTEAGLASDRSDQVKNNYGQASAVWTKDWPL